MTRRLLPADGDRPLLASMIDFLHAAGHAVGSAQSVDGAQRQLDERGFDVLIADLSLDEEGREGFDLVRHARRKQPGIRTIMLTATDTAAARHEAVRAGVDTFLL